jgi:beta-fructofuranosidase
VALRLTDKWVWDFWLAHDGARHHIFFLQAPRALGDPELRHRNATIGHAVSGDLTNWEVLPDALHPGPAGAWDDLATWTGSVIAHEDRWFMLYTGVSTAEAGLVQRIGLATSEDLIHWEKHPGNPVLEADARWYELLDLTRWRDQSWRDPWLFRADEDDHFHALITARVSTGPSDGAGVVAHARSRDLIEWEILRPITSPGEMAQAEVPQLVALDGGYRLLISCLAEDHSQMRRERLGAPGQTGTFAYTASSPFGPFVAPTRPLLGDDSLLGAGYAGKLVELEPGDLRFLCFMPGSEEDFVGELSDPLPVRCDGSRELVVEDSASQQPHRIPPL